MNVNLKIAIVTSGESQRRIAWNAGISESRLSTILHGWSEPKDWERTSIAHVLKRDASSLFAPSMEQVVG